MRIYDYDIRHTADYPWQFVQGAVCRIRVKCNEAVRGISVLYGDPFWFGESGAKLPILDEMRLTEQKELSGNKYFYALLPMETHKLRYHFRIIMENGDEVYLSELGVTEPVPEERLRPFMVPYVFSGEHYAAPEWAAGMVWYQIFPDRFAGAACDGASFIPTRSNFYGGTLRGITERVLYLKELGVQGVYINPIFCSPSNHRYDTTDYGRIDPRLGTEGELKELAYALHNNGMRLMLDGVFNHCSWEHPFWQDVVEKGETSEYVGWFYIRDIESIKNAKKEEFSPRRLRERQEFESFAFAADMPKWNTQNPAVIEYLTSQAARWTREIGVDAWRLDVPDEVSAEFLRCFKERVRQQSADIYIIGEIWQGAGWWLSRALFDGVMDYQLYFCIRDFALLGTDDAVCFARRVSEWYLSAPEAVRRHQLAFLSNHDIPRALTLCSGDAKRMRLSYFLTALLGGNLSIYYGDERGMEGGDDPDNRRAVDWSEADGELMAFMRELIGLKKTALRDIEIERIEVKGSDLHITVGSDKRLCAVIPPLDKKSDRLPFDMERLIFGSATACDGGVRAVGFALFEM